ncbi:ribonuclease H-like domain-containing protein [Tanacetum coccineum]
MTEMFGILKELTTSRAPKKVLMREEAKHPITKNVNSISLIRGEEEKNDDDNATTGDSIEKPNGSDAKMPLKEAEKENEAKNGTKTNQLKVLRRNSHELRKKKQWRHPALSLKLTDEMLTEMNIRLSLASHSYIYPLGIAEDILVDVSSYVYPVDFVIIDIKEDEKRPFILGTPFLTTAKAVIKFDKGTVTLRSRKSKMSFHRIPESLLRMTEVIKREFEKIKDVKVEDVPLICDASLEVFNDEHYGFTGSEDTDEDSSDNDDETDEVFRIDTNIFDYETPICSAFNEFNYLLKLTNCGKPTPLLGVRWYEALRDLNKSIEALRNKAIMEGSIKEDDESRYEQKRQWNTYTNYDDAYEINHEHNKSEELCEIQEQPVCNIKRYMMIKYSFNDDEEYVAVKEDEYDDLTVTRKEACRAYQEIFQIMDEGWMVTRAGKKVEAEKKSNLKTSL